jgi:predicted DNA-binding transcriptional regulator YafY
MEQMLIRNILTFGADAEVVRPHHIRDTHLNERNKITLKYKI